MSAVQKVDVLAVLDAQIAITARPHEAGLHDARAAVAELIEAAAPFKRMFYMHSREETERIRAALARIGGES